ncbi:tetratricopeptide repeat protein [Dyadobacter psychrotolerans]|uniref:Tetratricopeptide repeat protein n=1 Tax=Dyadobacter psychrotolerans TaxID=2541721 RepID=A0A4V2Z4P7_9BACT|nr:tetratricopeptide repeat protein [Dyadobacter psychrotolerans]TDE17478.1 tetratricopeptide repeat protein [Dyadobacter psychrotolerans]
MKNALLQNLLSFYEEDPSDPFNVYALALEYSKFDMLKAAAFFDILLAEHPEYLPAYYHAASFFAMQDKISRAEEIYIKGIALALNQKNTKTHQELLRAYRSFLDELDD